MLSQILEHLRPMTPKTSLRLTLAIIITSYHLSAEEGFQALFNGKNLAGWSSMAESKKEGTGSFFVDPEEKALRPYLGKEAKSKQPIDCLITDKEYSSFILKLEYKWLENRFAPRVDADRDAGILFHVHGNLNSIWPNCVEMQLGESDARKTKDRYASGDLWVIGQHLQVVNERKGQFYTPGSEEEQVGKGKKYDSSFILSSNEKPHGEWNGVTITVHGGKGATFELNGIVVNQIGEITIEEDGKRVPLEKGRIGLQAEYAELLYRNIRIKELKPE